MALVEVWRIVPSARSTRSTCVVAPSVNSKCGTLFLPRTAKPSWRRHSRQLGGLSFPGSTKCTRVGALWGLCAPTKLSRSSADDAASSRALGELFVSQRRGGRGCLLPARAAVRTFSVVRWCGTKGEPCVGCRMHSKRWKLVLRVEPLPRLGQR